MLWMIFPVLTFVFIYLSLLISTYSKTKEPEWREVFLSTSILWSLLLVGFTESLSLFHLIRFEWMLAVWIVATLLTGGVCIYLFAKHHWFHSFPLVKMQLSVFSWILIIGLFFLSGVLALLCLFSPPNQWDDLVYHMTRVMYWIQHQSIAHYPTHFLPQLYHPPFAEFVILNFQLLNAGDQFASLVQWFSYIGSLVGISLIVRCWGGGKRAQIFSSVFCATLPSALTFIPTAHNESVVTFWLICFVYFGTLLIQKANSKACFYMAASLGHVKTSFGASTSFGGEDL